MFTTLLAQMSLRMIPVIERGSHQTFNRIINASDPAAKTQTITLREPFSMAERPCTKEDVTMILKRVPAARTVLLGRDNRGREHVLA